jgi:ribosome biogenesis ATPase
MPPRIFNGLDRDVYQIIRKLEDQHVDEKTPPKLTTTSIYEAIKKSNSSLARQKKRPLEDSIDRVLRLRREEEEDDDEEADIEEAIATLPNQQVCTITNSRHGILILG